MKNLIPWKSWLVALVVLGAAMYLWNREGRLRRDAQRDAEQARLALKHQIVENDATRGRLQDSVDDLLKDNSELRAAFDAAMEAAPAASIASVSRLDTGPLRVQKKPPGVAVAPVAAPVGDAAPVAVATPCVITYEDRISIEVDELELQTKTGNTLVVGVASAYRVEPPPKELLARGQFRSTLSDSSQLVPPSKPRWGAEAAALCTVNGCGLGAGVLLPPFRVPLLGWQAEARVDAYAGPVAALAASLGARW